MRRVFRPFPVEIALVAVSAVVGWFRLSSRSDPDGLSLLFMLAPPVAGALVVEIVIRLRQPAEARPLAWHDALALPLIHVSAMATFAAMAGARFAFVEAPERLAPVLLWSEPKTLLASALGQAAALGVATALKAKLTRAPNADP